MAALRREDGVTLIELMVSIIVLGIIFSAVAVSLITFTRSASASEMRVEASALLNRLHEDFLLAPWERAGNVVDELDEATLSAAGLDVDVAGDSSTAVFDDDLDGVEREVVLVDDDAVGSGGDCTETFAARRAPRAIISDCNFRGRTYDVVQVVTWVDRSGDGNADTKRLTTVVEWEWLGQDFSERFDSERSPTTVEVPVVLTPRAVPTVTPGVVTLNDDGTVATSMTEFDVTVTFAPSGVVANTATIFYPVLESVGVVSEELVVLSPDPMTFEGDGYARFEGTIPVASHAFPLGSADFRVEASSTSDGDLTGTATVVFQEDDGGEVVEPPDEDVAISSFTANPTSVNFRETFNCTLTLTAFVRGLKDDYGSATVSYSDSSGSTQTADMTATFEPINPAGTPFDLQFGTTSAHGFTDAGNVSFTLTVSRPDGQSAQETLVVQLKKNNGNC